MSSDADKLPVEALHIDDEVERARRDRILRHMKRSEARWKADEAELDRMEEEYKRMEDAYEQKLPTGSVPMSSPSVVGGADLSDPLQDQIERTFAWMDKEDVKFHKDIADSLQMINDIRLKYVSIPTVRTQLERPIQFFDVQNLNDITAAPDISGLDLNKTEAVPGGSP